jgi:uroporphyrinogen III methyltransferase / synthase
VENSPCAYLVGAGPGDPGLITVRGRHLLRRADVIIYDHLVDSRLLRYARPNAELIFVGKKAGCHTLPQDQISQLLIEKAQNCECVVRLKGGDPFVFGRGGEESLELGRAGIAFEIIPGVTAGVAAAAYAGIPLTHRDFASSLAFITGHEDADRTGPSRIDWPALGRWQGTLVFYMSVKNLSSICRTLRQHGMSPDTPAALISRGTTPRQQTLTATVATLPDIAVEHNISPPAVIVIGQVVTLREHLNWFEKRPLFRRRIVVTRSRRQAGELLDSLTMLGADVLECPTIKIEPPVDSQPLHNAIRELHNYDWIIFTSVNGVDAFFGALDNLGLDTRHLAGARVCAIGPATAGCLKSNGLVADLIPPRFRAESIVETLEQNEKLEGTNILLPRADIAPPDLSLSLRNSGANVHEITAYRTVIDEEPLDGTVINALEQDAIDWITFTSSSTVRNFLERIDQKLLSGKSFRIASIGPVTSDTIRQAGLEVHVQPEQYTIPALIAAIIDSEKQNQTKKKKRI